MMKKEDKWNGSIFLLLFLLGVVFLVNGCGARNSGLMERILLGEHEDMVRSRYNRLSGTTQYVSYSVYGDFSQSQMEELGKAWYEETSDHGAGPVSKCSLAFYDGDSADLLYRFYYSGEGVLTDTENAYYIPGDVFLDFEPEEEESLTS